MSSRFNNDAQSRYSPIEGEALTMFWAINKADYFIYGCDKLYVGTDHKLLLAFFRKKLPKAFGPNSEQTFAEICV